jgi:hypothetical protein
VAETIPGGKRLTLAGDKNSDGKELVRELRGMNITPHVAQNEPQELWISGPRDMRGME